MENKKNKMVMWWKGYTVRIHNGFPEPLCQFDLRHNPSEIRIQTYVNMNGEGLRPSQSDDETFMDGARVQVHLQH